jgi:hypothetical protein
VREGEYIEGGLGHAWSIVEATIRDNMRRGGTVLFGLPVAQLEHATCMTCLVLEAL